MRCSRVRILIDDHVDGLLPAADAECVRDHMDDCRACRDAAFAARAASTSLAAWGDHEPPAACFDEILLKIRSLPSDAIPRPVRAGRLARAGTLRSIARRWSVPSMAAAAAVVAGFVVVERSSPATQRRIYTPTTAPVYAAASMEAGAAASARTRPVNPSRPAAPTASAAPRRDLRPGEEYVHLAPDRLDYGVRRVRLPDFPGAAAPIEASLFGTPR